ncbi:MAG: DUF2442 domain-containing protein [Planctomycetes bacterium]|nr:DUF2442 domain-containing protein [Planctomycetota bacterium]MBI3848517.1 DUF2442 domain-containing protein [Planctomycetota bacterium]
MKSAARGKRTFEVEVTNVSKHGFWLLFESREVFVPFERFPWFRDAAIGSILNVERPQAHHLYWPDLDVDLSVESIEHPERFPLVSRRRSPAKKKQLANGGSRRSPNRANRTRTPRR